METADLAYCPAFNLHIWTNTNVFSVVCNCRRGEVRDMGQNGGVGVNYVG
jgi:hypothetical protein